MGLEADAVAEGEGRRQYLLRAAAGFALAAVTMIPLGIFLGRVRVIGVVLEPLMDMLL